MNCPDCGSCLTGIIDSRKGKNGSIWRRRECKQCSRRFNAVEKQHTTDPAILNGIVDHLRRECHKWGGQTEWAQRHGFSRPYVCQIINGKYRPSARIAAALGVNLDNQEGANHV